MDVAGVADIVDDRHSDRLVAGVGEFLLGFPDHRQFVFILLAVVVRGKLDEEKGHPGIVEDLPPAVEQRIHFSAVDRTVGEIGAPLIPDHAAEGVGDEGVDHLIVEHGRRLTGVAGEQFGGEGRRLRQFSAGDGGGIEFYQPVGIERVDLGGRGFVFRGAGKFGVDLVSDIGKFRNAVESDWRRPGFDAGAAPIGAEQPDRYIEFALQVGSEEERRRGKFRCIGR